MGLDFTMTPADWALFGVLYVLGFGVSVYLRKTGILRELGLERHGRWQVLHHVLWPLMVLEIMEIVLLSKLAAFLRWTDRGDNE